MGKIVTCRLESALIESLHSINDVHSDLTFEAAETIEALILQLERRDTVMESILLKPESEATVDVLHRIRSEDHDVGLVLIATEQREQEIRDGLAEEQMLLPRLFFCREESNEILSALQSSLIATWRRRAAELLGVRTRLSEERSERMQLREQLSKSSQDLRSEARQRRQVQLALETERDMLLAMINNIPDQVFVKDVNSRFLLTNHALRDVMGHHEAEDYIGKTDFDFYPDDVAASYFTEEQEIIQSGKPMVNQEQRLYNLEGQQIWLLVSKMPFTNKENKIIGIVGICRDITRRKQSNERIRAAEQRYEDLYESSPDMCLTADLDGQIIECNQTLLDTLGYERDEVIQHSIYDFYDADCIGNVRATDTIFKEEGKVENIELTVLTKKSVEIFISFSATAFRNPRGEILYSRTVWRDITQRKLIEAELEDERKLLRTVIDLIPSRIFVKDLENRYMVVNQAQLKFLGVKEREEVLGKKMTDYLPGSTAEEILDDDGEIMETGTAQLDHEIEMIDKSGRMSWELSTKVPYTDNYGKITGIVGVSHNITKFKRAEERRRESEQRLQAFFSNTIALIFIKDRDRRFTMINRQYEMMLSKTNEEARGKTVFDVFPRAYAEMYDQNDLHVLESGELMEMEETAPMKDGIHTFLTMKFPLSDGFGNIHSIAGISTDITQRKKAEKELQERTKDLERSNRDLERSNRDLEQFAYIASHDLQEPLRMVASYVQLLNRRYSDKLDKNANEFIGYAVDGVTRMKKLITDLLTYSRVGTRKGEFVQVDCNQALRQALGNLRFAIEDCDADIQAGELPVIEGDEAQMVQLFQNLIGNALKFKRDKPEIRIDAKQHGPMYFFCISDNGIGIEDEFKDRIFDVFQRLHSNKDYEGTGIGLAVCKKIVERHGGRIWVESTPDKGSTFFFNTNAL